MKQCVFLLLALPLASLAQQPSNARLPYGVAYQQMKAFEQMAHLDKLEFGASISSQNPDVAPEDIEVTLDDQGNLHAFPLGPNGEIKIPVREDWMEDDMRFLETNQPSGSLRFNAHFEVKPLPAHTLDYAWLVDLAAQLEEAMANQPGVPEDAPDEIEGLIFDYQNGQQAIITIQAAAGSQALAVDADGHIHLQLQSSLAAENPEVSFTDLPNNIRPMVLP